MKRSKNRIARTKLALLSLAIITSGCMDMTSSDEQGQKTLIAALDKRTVFSECEVASGISILRPANSDDLKG
jgi:hypothetical protein